MSLHRFLATIFRVAPSNPVASSYEGTPAIAARGDVTPAAESAAALSPPVAGASDNSAATPGGNGTSLLAEVVAIVREGRESGAVTDPAYHLRKAAVFDRVAAISDGTDAIRAKWNAARARERAAELKEFPLRDTPAAQTCEHPRAAMSRHVPAFLCPDCGALFQTRAVAP